MQIRVIRFPIGSSLLVSYRRNGAWRSGAMMFSQPLVSDPIIDVKLGGYVKLLGVGGREAIVASGCIPCVSPSAGFAMRCRQCAQRVASLWSNDRAGTCIGHACA